MLYLHLLTQCGIMSCPFMYFQILICIQHILLEQKDFILVISMDFLDMGLDSLTHYQVRPKLHSQMKAPIWMKTYEIYFKMYINMIQKIVNNPRPNMHELKNPWSIFVNFQTKGKYCMGCQTLGLLGWLKNPCRLTSLKSPSILLYVLLGFFGFQTLR